LPFLSQGVSSQVHADETFVERIEKVRKGEKGRGREMERERKGDKGRGREMERERKGDKGRGREMESE
jgi:hypothetical protein